MSITPNIIERSRTLQVMDCLGYIPGLGIGIGAARMTGSVACLALAALGYIFTTCDKESLFLATRSIKELNRGAFELIPIPFLMLIIDLDIARFGSSSSTFMAHGRYMCRDNMLAENNNHFNNFKKPDKNWLDAWRVVRTPDGEKYQETSNTVTATQVVVVKE